MPPSDSEKTHVCLPCYGRLSSLGQQSPCHRHWLTGQCHTLPLGAPTLQPAPSPGSQVVRLPFLWTRGHLLLRWLWDHSPERPPNQPSKTRDRYRFSWELFSQVMTEPRTFKSHVFVYLQVPPFPAAHPREESTVRTGDASFPTIPKGEGLIHLEMQPGPAHLHFPVHENHLGILLSLQILTQAPGRPLVTGTPSRAAGWQTSRSLEGRHSKQDATRTAFCFSALEQVIYHLYALLDDKMEYFLLIYWEDQMKYQPFK